jgi:hypothetical protein
MASCGWNSVRRRKRRRRADVHVGVAGPVGLIRERLTGFPDVTTSIVDMFVSGDKLAVSVHAA